MGSESGSSVDGQRWPFTLEASQPVAYHEAAHAVALLHVQKQFTEIFVAGESGMVTMPPPDLLSLAWQEVLDLVFACLAGPAQDLFRHGRLNRKACCHDFESAEAYIRALGADQTLFDEQWARALAFVAEPAQAVKIEAVAQALYVRHRLAFAEAALLVTGVDG